MLKGMIIMVCLVKKLTILYIFYGNKSILIILERCLGKKHLEESIQDSLYYI